MNTLEKDIENYLNGEMSKEETTAFLQKIASDPEAKSMLELYQEMNIVYDDQDWNVTDKKSIHKKIDQYESFLKSDKGVSVANKIKAAEQSYFDTQRAPKTKMKLLVYVAGIAAVLIAGLFLTKQFDTTITSDQLYADYKNWDAIPSLTLRAEDTHLARVEKLFVNKNYKESLRLLEEYVIANHQETNPQIMLYIGISQLELDKNKRAIATFTKLLNSNTLDAPKAHWYLALCYLKQDKSAIAKTELLKLLEKTTFQKVNAQHLLDKLE